MPSPRRIYGPGLGSENFKAENVERGFSKVMQFRYGSVEDRMGAQFWGTTDMPTTGLHNEELYYTDLLGQAKRLNNLREMPPMARYETAHAIYADYQVYGIAFELYQDEVEDELYGITVQRVADLPTLMTETEEDTFFEPYNNGETTFISGWANTPLFGDTKIIGDPSWTGNNIIPNAGGPSYTAISLIEQYGDNFINEEGRTSPIKPVMIMTGRANARLWEMYYNASTNIEQSNPLVPNPSRERPVIKGVQRLANPNDSIVFYQGWEQDMQVRNKYRGRKYVSKETLPAPRIVTMIKSRFAFLFRNNRRIVLLKGSA